MSKNNAQILCKMIPDPYYSIHKPILVSFSPRELSENGESETYSSSPRER